ncbi:hypothetical protein J9253_18735 [Thiothrix litoralis]|uniref:Uncharacterized protein n=1 Tax=Thiothrix litoralis TaxID=2891210 RepID=A0ABX7WR23_9GAMM|nr:hypothetical protein [Thiothrix litoralis]QTR45995.1 hypothetical protein J9253_18735 [Thiothrix litoralis]
MKNKGFSVSVCLLASMLMTSPATALSAKGIQTAAVQGSENTPVTSITVEQGNAPASLHGFIPDMVDPRLYLYLLQSDQFITLQGLIDDYQENNIIKNNP